MSHIQKWTSGPYYYKVKTFQTFSYEQKGSVTLGFGM